MDEIEKTADRQLLYDPLFETPPDTVIRDDPKKGFFGKAVVKKTVFILVLLLFVGVSIGLSFSSLAKDKYYFDEIDGGYRLTEFNAGKTDAVLEVGPVFAKNGSAEPDKTVVAVKEFAVCCNEYTSIIMISKDVHEIPNTAFYSCSNLLAVIVDPDNPNYRSIDGVLYRLENGKPVELILYPARCDLYRSMLALGEPEPLNADAATVFIQKATALRKTRENWLKAQQDGYPANDTFDLSDEEIQAFFACLRYEIEPGVTKIGELAFAECDTLYEVTIPEGVVSIDTMAFFKCGNLRSFNIPDSVETIGSDAFSYCAKADYLYIPASVTSIGHHAFFGCDAIDEVQMGCAEDNKPKAGEYWIPKHRKVFLKEVPVVYGCERRDG